MKRGCRLAQRASPVLSKDRSRGREQIALDLALAGRHPERPHRPDEYLRGEIFRVGLVTYLAKQHLVDECEMPLVDGRPLIRGTSYLYRPNAVHSIGPLDVHSFGPLDGHGIGPLDARVRT